MKLHQTTLSARFHNIFKGRLQPEEDFTAKKMLLESLIQRAL